MHKIGVFPWGYYEWWGLQESAILQEDLGVVFF